jgi:hypothetical protein
MAPGLDEWARELEAALTAVAADMWAPPKRLEERGFRIDGGNKITDGVVVDCE